MMVSFTLPFKTNEIISISKSQTFRSWAAISHLLSHMAFISLNSYGTPGLAPPMNVLFWGRDDFPATQTRIPRGTLEDVIQDVWWSIRGSYSAIWSLTNVKWHSDPWLTVTSQLITLSYKSHNLDTELDLHRIMSGFDGVFATNVACQ